MKNEKIIEAWDKMKPSEETKQQIFNETIRKHQRRSKVSLFKLLKPTRILATALSIVLIVGLFGIQTIIAFIGGLFFTPGVGITHEPTIYEGLEAPVDIETEYGLMTLRFVTKITSNGTSSLGLQLCSVDILAHKVVDGDYPIYLTISADGETIISDAETNWTASWGDLGSQTKNFVSYMYICGDFPDVSEFDLTILGVTTHISLTEQPDNYALSKENNNITLVAYRFSGVTNMIAVDVFDSSEGADDYNVFGYTNLWEKYYGENGEKIRGGSGFGTHNPESPLNYQINDLYENEISVKSIASDGVRVSYIRKEPLAVEIPVPKDGETIQTDIEIPIGSYTYRITEVRREGDIISYKNNSCMVLSKNYPDDSHIGLYRFIGIPTDHKSPEWEQAVANNESFIQYMSFVYDVNSDVSKSQPQMIGGEIWDFDQDAETLTFYFKEACVIQFGDFDIEFN